MDSENCQLDLPYRASSVSVYWKKITIPKGLPALLETFVREAIRENPDDIHKFLADLTQSMLAKRGEEQKEAESSNAADANTTSALGSGGASVVASNGNATKQKSVDEESPLLVESPPASIQSTTIEIEDQKQKPAEEAEKPLESVVTVVPKQQEEVIAFEGLPEENDAAATRIQANFRGYQTRKHLDEEQQKPEEQQPDAASQTTANTSSDDNNVDVTDASVKNADDVGSGELVGNSEQEIQAATKIQAGYRGFQTRKQLKEGEQREKREIKFEEPITATSSTEKQQAEAESTAEALIAGVEEALTEEIQAATKIQAGFRGFQTRKALNSSRPEDDESQNVPVEEECLSATCISAAAVSPSPKPDDEESGSGSSPAPTDNEKDEDEEIAAEIKTPLETIREESFDCSSHSQQAPPPATMQKTEETDAKSSPDDENAQTEIVATGQCETMLKEDAVEETSTSSPDEDISKAEDHPAAVVAAIPTLSSAPNSASRTDRLYNVHMISTEDVSAALGDLLDDTEDEEEESISEDDDEALEIFEPSGTIPILEEALQDQAGGTKGPTDSNNDTDNKNDELKSSSDNGPAESSLTSDSNGKEINDNARNDDDDDGIKDNKTLDEVQNGDHQTETSSNPITDEEQAKLSTETTTSIPIPPNEKNENDEVFPIAPPTHDNHDDASGGDGVVEAVVIEEKTQNIPPEEEQANDDEQKQEQEGQNQDAEKAAVTEEDAINLSSSEEIPENSGNACETTTNTATTNTEGDQTAICADDRTQGEEEDVGDKNTKSDHGKDDDKNDDGIISNIGQSTEKDGETNAEKNTPNTTSATEDDVINTAPQQEEVGQQQQQDAVDDGEGEEKSGAESIQLQQSNASALTESSVDREDTDIATPTDFSLQHNNLNSNPTQEEADKDSLNLEELKKFAQNFEEEAEATMEPTTGSNAEGAVPSAEQKMTETGSPPATTTPTTESSSESVPAAGSAEVMQVEVKSPEPQTVAESSSKPETPALTEEPPTPILRPENSEAPSESVAPTSEPASISNEVPQAEKPAEEVAAAPVQSSSTETPSEAPKDSESPASAEAEIAKSPEPAEPEKPAEAALAQTPPAIAADPEGSSPAAALSAEPEKSAETPVAEQPKSPEPQAQEIPVTNEQVVSPTVAPSATEVALPSTPADTSEPAKIPEAPVSEQQPKSPEVPAPPPSEQAQNSQAAPDQAQSPEVSSPSAPETTEAPAASTPEQAQNSEAPTTPSPTESAQSPEAQVTESAKTPETTPAQSPEASQPATSPAPETTAAEQGSEPPKTESSEACAPSATEAAPVPEQAVTAQPSQATETPTVPPTSESTPAPSSTPAPEPPTTNQAEQSETSVATNEPIVASPAPTGPTEPVSVEPAAADNKDSNTVPAVETAATSPAPNETVAAPPASSADVAPSVTPAATPETNKKEEVDIASTNNASNIHRDSEDSNPEKPTVKPRTSQRSSPNQARSVGHKEEYSSVGEGEGQQSPTVLRRPKSGPGRSRVATTKYRSGLVIDSQMSMEEMEKEIENEMLNNAATKIQAGFRGFQTRKRFSTNLEGVSSRKGKKGDGESRDVSGQTTTEEGASASAETASECTANVEGAVGGGLNVQGDLEDATTAAAAIASREGRKPSLGALRSFSFPGSGSHEDPMGPELEDGNIPTAISEQNILGFVDEGEEDLMINPEPDIDLDLDPDYINRAATRIQANFRGYQVRKSFKRPSSGKENNGSKSSPKSQKLAEAARQEIEDRARALEQRLQENNNNENPPAQPDKAAAKIQASFRGYKERHKFHQQKRAAITIQANIRGYLTRKRFANLRRRSFQRRRSSAKAFQKELDEMRKVNEAATKIQAVFRGYQVRSKMPRSSSMINVNEQMIDE